MIAPLCGMGSRLFRFVRQHAFDGQTDRQKANQHKRALTEYRYTLEIIHKKYKI